MARQTAGLQADALGQIIGQALGEGLMLGLEQAFATVRVELEPLRAEVLAALRREASEMADRTAREIADAAAAEEARICGDNGCNRKPVARGLCRKHYARKVYEERKLRTGGGPVRARKPRSLVEGGTAVSKKPVVVAAVAPIVRRRKADAPEAEPVVAEQAERTVSLAPPPKAVTAESIAKLWGIAK